MSKLVRRSGKWVGAMPGCSGHRLEKDGARRNASGRHAFRAIARPGAIRRIGTLAVWIAALVLTNSEARAALVTYGFTGVVNSDTAGLLFPTKNPGDPFSGSFVLDTGATVGFANTEVASYTGTFTIVLDALTFNATGVQVWSGSYVDGFEIGFPVPVQSGGGTVFLSMRSSANIYAGPSVPSSVNLADFDALHHISYSEPFPAPGLDRGTITSLSQIPEPTTGLLVGLGLGVLSIGRNRRTRR